MIIRNISAERFEELVGGCCDDVYLHLCDGNRLNIKRQAALIRTLGIPEDGIQITCADRQDAMRFVRGMIGIF